MTDEVEPVEPVSEDEYIPALPVIDVEVEEDPTGLHPLGRVILAEEAQYPAPTPTGAPTLPSGFTSGAALPITKPGYLFELGFTPPLRFSTRGDQTFGGNVFAGGFVASFDVGSKKLALLNPANGVSSVVIVQGVADRPVKVWQFYGDTVSTSNSILLLDGFIDGAPNIGEKVVLSLYDQAAGVLFSPRLRINRFNGFNVLPQPGLRIQWGNALFVLNPGRD